jgi:hypothetical protein
MNLRSSPARTAERKRVGGEDFGELSRAAPSEPWVGVVALKIRKSVKPAKSVVSNLLRLSSGVYITVEKRIRI